jgi:uncharacterized iron-regulated protein
MARWAVMAALLSAGCAPAAIAVAPRSLVGVRAGEREIGFDDLVARAIEADLVCIGEQHDDAEHHRFQRVLVEALARASERDGRRMALGMEMFGRSHQAALDAFDRGELSVAELPLATDWKRSWGFDYAMYQPLLETARAHRVRVIGLNAPRELPRAVGRNGLDALPAAVRGSLPELDLEDAGHRKFFWAIMGFDQHGHGDGGHGHGHGGAERAERFYAAQVIWDETMAESAAAWLEASERRRIAVIAGNGHCHESAIPARVARRTRKDALSVLLRSHDGELPPHAPADLVVELR